MKLKIIGGIVAAMLLVPAVVAEGTLFSMEEKGMEEYQVPVAEGEVLELNARDLEFRMGIASGGLNGITVTQLPRQNEGVLFLDGIEVEAFDYFSRDEIDRLVFVPYEGVNEARFWFLPNIFAQESVTTSLNVKVLAGQNSVPQLEGFQIETVKNVGVQGYLNVVSTNENEIGFRLLTTPKKGKLTFRGASFVYEPFYDVAGSDSFTVCAVDSVGNFSKEALVQIQIEKQRQTFQYTDMLTNPSHYAAIKLRENGVFSGTQVGDAYFFFPDRVMLRGDFVLLLLESCGARVSPTVNSGLPNDSELPQWFKPYAKAAVNCGILPKNQAFVYYEVPTRAEAVVLTNRASGINDVKQYSLWMTDRGEIPEWAAASYMNLAAYRMLDLYEAGKALPVKALNNSYAADLAWQLYKHKHR